MKAHLLFPDRDPPTERPVGPLAEDLRRDLDLGPVLDVLAAGDGEIRSTTDRLLLTLLTDPEVIRYRQAALRDCLEEPGTVRDLYRIVGDALEAERREWGWSDRSASSVLYRSLRVMPGLLASLRAIRSIADSRGPRFRSRAFEGLFQRLRNELDDRFFAAAAEHLEHLQDDDRRLFSARLGPEGKGVDWTLRTPRARRVPLWRRWIVLRRDPHTVTIDERDESGHRILGEIVDRGMGSAAVALGRSTDHLLQFLRSLRGELGFYIGSLNLHDRLRASGNPVCFPEIADSGGPSCVAEGLYDVGLALRLARPLILNDLRAAGKRFVAVTGANQGGKSTLLRAVGLAQLFGQAGSLVGARAFSTAIASGVFAHFRREEDATMKLGKLEEELTRFAAIARAVRPGALVLCNESLNSTNEREGSEIATEIVGALVDSGVVVVYVTFLFEFADRWRQTRADDSVFLRVERLADGRRTFRLVPGPPLPTSFADDLGRRILGPRSGATPVASVES